LQNFAFDRKSIKQVKDRSKKENRAKGKGMEGIFWRKRDYFLMTLGFVAIRVG
jgi:hypothetical protein